MSLVPPDCIEKFAKLTVLPYGDQAKWWLNGFWEEAGGEKDAEKIWDLVELFKKLDQRGANGNDLDEFWSHKFLEELGETLTALKLREKLRLIDVDNNKRMALVEYLLFKFKKDVKTLVNASQGGVSKEQLDEAQSNVDAASEAVTQLSQKQEELKEALAALAEAEKLAKKAQEEAKSAEDEALATEEAAKKADEEQKTSLAALHAQEKAYEDKVAELERKSKTGGVVSMNRAKAELEMAKSEDPLPLRRAKLNQEACVRKTNKARKEAEAAAAKATEARCAADESLAAAAAARAASEEAAQEVENAIVDAEAAFKAALEYLESLKSQPGAAYGDIWWMEREIEEKKKYLPRKRQAAQ